MIFNKHTLDTLTVVCFTLTQTDTARRLTAFHEDAENTSKILKYNANKNVTSISSI